MIVRGFPLHYSQVKLCVLWNNTMFNMNSPCCSLRTELIVFRCIERDVDCSDTLAACTRMRDINEHSISIF